jgi:hypothetical protein
MSKKSDDHFNEKEVAQRRDEVIRRMANTPPQHKEPKPKKPAKPKRARSPRAAG